jgi:hypothetical protein
VHRKLPDHVYRWKINDRFQNGVADAWYCGNGGNHLFIEYKYVVLPQKDSTLVRVGLSTLQVDWLTGRQVQGIPCSVIVGSEHGSVWFDDIAEAHHGVSRKEFIDRSVSVQQIAGKIAGICTGAGNDKSHNHSVRPGDRSPVQEYLVTEETAA